MVKIKMYETKVCTEKREYKTKKFKEEEYLQHIEYTCKEFFRKGRIEYGKVVIFNYNSLRKYLLDMINNKNKDYTDRKIYMKKSTKQKIQNIIDTTREEEQKKLIEAITSKSTELRRDMCALDDMIDTYKSSLQ